MEAVILVPIYATKSPSGSAGVTERAPVYYGMPTSTED